MMLYDAIGTAMKVLHLQEVVKITEIKEFFLNSTQRNVLIRKGNFSPYKGQLIKL